MPKRTLPNIIITGTPGTGKTTHAEQLATATGLRHVSVNQVAKERDCHDGYDEEVGSWIVDEDKVGFPDTLDGWLSQRTARKQHGQQANTDSSHSSSTPSKPKPSPAA